MTAFSRRATATCSGYTSRRSSGLFHEDPAFLYFRQAIQPVDKATIDNADALYLSAAVDGERTYRIRGRVLPKAPQYIIFETHVSYAGDSGSLAELSPVNRMITGSLDSAELLIDDDGGFEIRRTGAPRGYVGNYLPSRKVTEMATGTAGYVIVRMLFHDWENEQSPELGIVAVRSGGRPSGNRSTPPRPPRACAGSPRSSRAR